jgi:3-(3-hydroxy-phenyl)propionate hydroxylase
LVADRWRSGRVFVAGDAAHQQPPFLGQGMCSGIRDAHALAWRLDLILGGHSDPAILADYVTERAGHVDHIIHGAMFLGSVSQTRNPVVAKLRNLLLFRLTSLVPPLKQAFARAANRKQPLSGGCFGTNRRRIAGQLMSQPKVRTEDGALVLLDEVLGRGFAVVARGGALGARGAALGPIPLRLVEFAPVAGHGAVADAEGKLERFLRSHKADFVIVRPDRYVFDAGSAADLPACLAALTAHLRLRTADMALAS